MKALIVPNLVDVIDKYFAGSESHRTDPEFLAFAERIAGKEVELVFIAEDAFEKEDNNYWLPDVCWSPVCGVLEGETCEREGCKGIIVDRPVENCSCHLGHPPCSACVTDRHTCTSCGWEPGDD